MVQVWKHFIPSRPHFPKLSISGSPPSTNPQIATSNRIHQPRHAFAMEFPKRERAFPQGSSRRSPKATRPGAAMGADENASPRHLVPVGAASPKRKRVLGERNDCGVEGMEGAASPVQQPKPAPSPPTLAGRGAGPYDPKMNYATPRPAFLRYDPERRREILLRVSRATEVMYDDYSSTTSGTAVSEEDGGSSLASDAAGESPISSASWSDSEAELDDREEEEEVVPGRGRWARRLFLLLVFVFCSLCYIYCSNPSGIPDYSEDALDLDRGIGGMYDAYDHELDSLRLLGTSEDVMEENRNQIVLEDTKSLDYLYGNKASPRNLVAVTVMGLADICLNVSLGELTCQIGSDKSERSENVNDLDEDSEMDELQLVSMEKEIKSISYKMDRKVLESEELDLKMDRKVLESEELDLKMDRKVLESEELDLKMEELDLWQYENTAEAAKEICSTVKFMWSAMQPHLLQILACLSFAGFVAALYRYYQRSRERRNCIITCDSLAVEPLLVPHQVVQLPVTSSAQDAQLPVHSSEQPMQLTIPNPGLPASLEVPMELTLPKPSPMDPVESLPKTDPLVTLKVPVIGHGIHDQKLEQGDHENMKASNGRFLNHNDVDSFKPPMVELLGEFMFANSSRGRSTKRMNHNAEDDTVQESLDYLGNDEDVDKMQVHSSIIQSPSVRRAKEQQEKSVRGEKKTDATPARLTPTPLRRSSRLRNKVTSP